MSELKKCPFCGGIATLVLCDGNTNVICSCGASFTHERKLGKYTIDETINAWNYRAFPTLNSKD